MVLTGAQMRALEAAAIESGRATGPDLMERAGRGAVDAALAEWPDLASAPHRAVVLCGPGNNGGDGYVVARVLAERGWEVEVFALGDPARLLPDAAGMAARWHGPVRALSDAALGRAAGAPGCALVVDALFGIGLSREVALPQPCAQLFETLTADGVWTPNRARPPYVVALDVPSGLDADTGRMRSRDDIRAHLTVAFSHLKPGHLLAEGPDVCGAVRVVDLGLPDPEGGVPLVGRPERDTAGSPHPAVKRSGHKFDHGHALVLGGGVGRGGAARLAVRAALRVGAGLATLCPPPAALIENAARLDAVMLRAVRDAEALAEVADDRVTALCLGPGLGTTAREAALVAASLAMGRPTVLDADALTLIAGDDALRGALHGGCVLTPHGGEFARLAPDLAARLSEDATFSKIDAARAAAARLGCTVLLKGPDTVIAAPSGRVSIHAAVRERAAPWLATAGAGDVLAGLIAGLLARGFEPVRAAETGAWLHVEAARGFGPGLIAEDLPDLIPGVLAAL